MRRSLAALLVVAPLAFACDGEDWVPTDGGVDAAVDAPPVVPPACRADDGTQLCGGPAGCPYSTTVCSLGCSGCIEPCCADTCVDGGLGVCYGTLREDPTPFCGWSSRYGDICWLAGVLGSRNWFAAPLSLGELLANNGGRDRVRYTDMSLFTGEPIPDVTTCPSVAGVRFFGGACGTDCGRPDGLGYRMRSPLHPVGICDSDASGGWACASVGAPCATGMRCFAPIVQPETQKLADSNGVCVPADACTELEQKWPGGGRCL